MEKEDEVTVLHLYVKPSLIHEAAAVAELDPSKIEIINTLGVRDANVERIGLSLLAELENENLGGRLYAETLATQLALQLLRGYSSVMQTPVREPSGGLPPAKLRRVFEYIHENLDGDLSLCELAATVEISPFHFARLFKSATGLTPNCYVTERRIERAENLLAETKLPLVEIANLVGFSSQAHFTTIFRRVTGRTPGAYRDEF